MRTKIFAQASLISVFAILAEAKLAMAAGVVGNGTPGSCTEPAFTKALAGGGVVTFNCGGANTLVLTSPKTISQDTTVEGGYKMILSGGGKTSLFQVTSSGRLILAGITLDQGFSSQNGGAILSHGGLILNTVTISNSATSNLQQTNGGAIFTDGASTVILNSKFIDNSSGSGGAISVNSPAAVVQVTGGAFEGNTARLDGGAVYVASDRKFTFKDTLFSTNSALYGGALYADGGTTVSLYGTPPASPTTPSAMELTLNAASEGGAILNLGALTVDEALFDSNSATPGSHGSGGAIASYGTLSLTRSQMLDNVAALNGGAISVNGGLPAPARADIQTTVFAGNDAGFGGGLAIDVAQSPPTVSISSSSFDSNHAVWGGGVARPYGLQASQLTITKSSFTNNRADQGGGGLYLAGNTPQPYWVLVQSVTFGGNSGAGAAVDNEGSGVELYSDTIIGNVKIAISTSGGNTRFRDTVLQNPFNCATSSPGTTSDDLANFATDLTCNLFGSKQGTGLDPILATWMKDPNGVTSFVRPAGGSPLIDKGIECPATDQIGEPPHGASCDIGAVEYEGLDTGNGGLN